MLKKASTYISFCLILVVVLFVVVILAINLGAVDIEPAWVVKIILNKSTGREIFQPEWPASAEIIVWELRMPKVVAAICVGAALSIAGILMQAPVSYTHLSAPR